MTNNKFLITILVLSVVLSFFSGMFIGKSLWSGEEKEVKQFSLIQLPNGREVKIPEGHKATIEYEVGPSSEGYEKRITSGKASGGSSYGGTVLDNAIGIPELDLTEGQEKGSGGDIEAKIKNTANSGTTIIIIAGLLFIVAGVLAGIFAKNLKLAVILGVIGALICGSGLLVQTYPWILLVGAIGILAALVGFVYWAWKTGRLELTLKQIIGGVESADPAAAEVVKASIAEQASDKKEQAIVKDEVTKIKIANNL
jgi:hypothetical protein